MTSAISAVVKWLWANNTATDIAASEETLKSPNISPTCDRLQWPKSTTLQSHGSAALSQRRSLCRFRECYDDNFVQDEG